MVTSDVELGNGSLSILGLGPVASFDLDNERSRTLKERYPVVRDAMFRSHRWNFSIKEAALAEVTGAEVPLFRYTTAYRLPGDFIRLDELEFKPQDYKLEGGLIKTNTTGVLNIIYIALLTVVEKYDALFVVALQAELASDMAQRLGAHSAARQAVLVEKAKDALRDARMADGQEDSAQAPLIDSWIVAAGLTPELNDLRGSPPGVPL